MIFLYILLSTALLSVCKSQDTNEFYKLDESINFEKYVSQYCYSKYYQKLDHFEELLLDYRKFLLKILESTENLCESFTALTRPADNLQNREQSESECHLKRPMLKFLIFQIFASTGLEQISNDVTDSSMLKDLLLNFKDEQFKTILYSELSTTCLEGGKMKRDKFGQKVRFHSWGGKRNRDAGTGPKLVIR